MLSHYNTLMFCVYVCECVCMCVLSQRLDVARAIGNLYSELCTLCNLGNCYRAKGSLSQALEYYQMVSLHATFNL